jgi:hypothetical protein
MPTTQQEFKDLAEELVSDEFADFFPLRTFSQLGNYNPITETYDTTTEQVNCMREEYNASQFGNDLVQVGDFKLLARVDAFSLIDPRTDNVKVDVDGQECQVIRAEKDPADAMWTVQLRES